MQKGLRTRYIIFEILKILKVRAISFNEIFLEKVENKNFNISDQKMIHNVVLNTMRFNLYTDNVIKTFAKKINKSSDSYFLLQSAITQLLVLKFKDFAVINSTVELAKNKKINAPPKFINGILRNINRNKTILLKLNYNFSQLPLWFKKRIPEWDKKEKVKFINNIHKEPDLHLVFKNKKDIKNIKSKKIQTSDHSIAIKNSILIKNIEGYYEGLWWVQDFSAMMPLYLINNLKNRRVVDLCAAPGGKSFQLISKGAKVKAIEKNYKRAELMKKNLTRLQFNCKLEVKDVLLMKNEKFDLVVLDAPCSSIGTIRRHPEILYRKTSPDFKKITSMQAKLLEKAKTLLKNNGVLIYMVCSFFNEEGKIQINKFLEKNKNFNLVKFSSKGIYSVKHLINKDGFFYTMPSKLKNNVLIDGFFAAIIMRND